MRLIRSREHVINMGQYESVRVGASVELDIEFTADTVSQDVYDEADRVLAASMASDIQEAIDLLPPGSASYILSWKQPDILGDVNA